MGVSSVDGSSSVWAGACDRAAEPRRAQARPRARVCRVRPGRVLHVVGDSELAEQRREIYRSGEVQGWSLQPMAPTQTPPAEVRDRLAAANAGPNRWHLKLQRYDWVTVYSAGRRTRPPAGGRPWRLCSSGGSSRTASLSRPRMDPPSLRTDWTLDRRADGRRRRRGHQCAHRAAHRTDLTHSARVTGAVTQGRSCGDRPARVGAGVSGLMVSRASAA